MNLVTIEKTTKKKYDCNVYRCGNKKLFKVNFPWNMFQGRSIVLCKDHLNELGCAIADALDPPRSGNKEVSTMGRPVGWLKVIEDNAKRRKMVPKPKNWPNDDPCS